MSLFAAGYPSVSVNVCSRRSTSTTGAFTVGTTTAVAGRTIVVQRRSLPLPRQCSSNPYTVFEMPPHVPVLPNDPSSSVPPVAPKHDDVAPALTRPMPYEWPYGWAAMSRYGTTGADTYWPMHPENP